VETGYVDCGVTPGTDFCGIAPDTITISLSGVSYSGTYSGEAPFGPFGKLIFGNAITDGEPFQYDGDYELTRVPQGALYSDYRDPVALYGSDSFTPCLNFIPYNSYVYQQSGVLHPKYKVGNI